MIVNCDKCNKKFSINEALIPEEGRLLKCGNCGNQWFYKIQNDKLKEKEKVSIPSKNPSIDKKVINKNKKIKSTNIDNNKSKKKENYLSKLIVIIISFIALILVFDTFKNEIEKIFPNIIPLLENFYLTLNDLILFFKDLFRR